MAATDRSASRVVAIVLVAALAVVVAVLSVLALQRSGRVAESASPNPVPTFTLGVEQSATPTPTPVATPEAERFLSAAAGALWRSTAGSCDGDEPLVERSIDDGVTWTDVTPRYRGLARVFSLTAFADTEAQMVAAVAACEVQALRTYTQGTYWESYPDVLAASTYLSAGTIVTPAGPVPPPCAAPSGLRSSDQALTLLCDRVAWIQLPGAEWSALPATGAVAVAVEGSDVLVAYGGAEECAGLALTLYRAGDAAAAQPIGCAEVPDAASPTAIAITVDRVLVWSGDTFAIIPR